jgi:peptide/nickel transport system permease protein
VRVLSLAGSIGRHVLAMFGAILLAAFIAACLMRIAPGFTADPGQLDSRLSAASVQELRAARARNRNVVKFYLQYLAAAARGDLGQSQLFHRPTSELIAERAGMTARLIALGLLGGWTFAVALAATVVVWRRVPVEAGSAWLAGLFICLPAAVLALVFVLFRAPAWLAIALSVFPKVFGYTRNLLLQAELQPHVVTARAKGLRAGRVLWLHVFPPAAPQILALGGISVSMAIGVAIPIESLLSLPGLGQLAWQAALGRDLPLLVSVTLVVTTVTLIANRGADLLSQMMRSGVQRRVS